MDATSASVKFGSYRFVPSTGQLIAGRQEVRLTPKAAAVLAELIAHAGQPVTKGDLFACVWPGTAVSDDALTSCIKELRRALGDDPRQPKFIETRHRRGYRFITQIAGEPLAKAPLRDGTPVATSTPAAEATHQEPVAANRGGKPTLAVFRNPAHIERYLDGLRKAGFSR